MFPLNPKAYYNEEPTGNGIIVGSLSINTTTKIVKQWDGANWNTISTGGAGHVFEPPQGNSFDTFVLEVGVGGGLTPAYSEFNDGLAALEIFVFPVTALPAASKTTGLLFGWSATASDQAAIKTNLDGLAAKMAAAGAAKPPLFSNAVLLNDQTKHDQWIPVATAKPGTTIDTVAFRNIAAATATLLVGIVR